jgi:PGF-pre-PGF domain-containing protein
MNSPASYTNQFSYSINGETPRAFSAAALDSNPDIFDLTTSGTIAAGSTVTVNYTGSSVTSTDGGFLAVFNNRPVTNSVVSPTQTPTPTPTSVNLGDGGGNDYGGTVLNPSAPSSRSGQGPSSILSVNVGGNTPVNQVTVTGTGISGLIVTSSRAPGPGTGVSQPPGTVDMYLDITPAQFTTITGAEISFTVPQSWLDAHYFTPQDIVLYHNVGTEWQALTTSYANTVGGNVYFTAMSPGFSRFVIVGQPGHSVSSQNVTVQAMENLVKPSGTGSSPFTEVPGTRSPAPMQTTAPAAAVPQPATGFPLATIALIGAGCVVVLMGGGFVLWRWWVRRQNPALFRELE